MKKQVSIRIDEEYYTKLRIELLKDGISFQEYVLDLIKKDGKVKSKWKKEYFTMNNKGFWIQT